MVLGHGACSSGRRPEGDAAEALVHFHGWAKRFDEWVSVACATRVRTLTCKRAPPAQEDEEEDYDWGDETGKVGIDEYIVDFLMSKKKISCVTKYLVLARVGPGV